MSEGVLCNWVRAASETLEPIWEELHKLRLDSTALHIDETPIRRLKSDKTNGYMWALSSADNASTLYFWQNRRSAEALNHLLHRGMQPDGRVYEGAILSDGYGGYESCMKTLFAMDAEVLRLLPTHRASEGYWQLLPGGLQLPVGTGKGNKTVTL